jgi:hypothetical protein
MLRYPFAPTPADTPSTATDRRPWLGGSTTLLAWWLAGALLGCTGSAPGYGGTARPAGDGRAAGALAAALQFEDPTFQVAVEAPPFVVVGGKATVDVRLRARSPWHLNREFPTYLRLDPPAAGIVTVQGLRLEAAQASVFTDAELVFSFPALGVRSGSGKLHGTVKFAVCTDKQCDPKSYTLDLPITVK